MEIRRATREDAEGINSLLFQVLEVHHKGRPDLFYGGVKKYSDEELCRIMEDDTRPIFVAVDGKKVLGYAFLIFQQIENSHILTPVKTLYIDDLCVDASCRKTGIGKALFEFVRAFGKENGFYNLTLNVWACNTGAMAFYERCGLVPQKVYLEEILNGTEAK